MPPPEADADAGPGLPAAPQQDAARLLGELAIAAAGIGTYDWDLVDGTLTWDEQLLSLFGYAPGTFGSTIESFNERVHPADLPRVTAALQRAIDTCGEYEAEYRIVLPGGAVRWIAARGRTLCGDDGAPVRLLGAAYDTTADLDAQSRVVRILEGMPTAFYSLDEQWRFSYVNAEAERLLGRPRGELLGGVVWDLFPAAVGSEFELQYRRAVGTGRPTTFEAYYPAPLDGWYELRAWPGPEGLAVYFLDITERRRQQDEAEHAARRAELVARVTADLSETLDAEQAVGRLAQLSVPSLAQWCLVTLADDTEGNHGRRLKDIGWWHADPDRRDVVREYSTLRLQALQPGGYLFRALEGAEPIVLEGRAGERVAQHLAPGRAAQLLAGLAAEHALFLPLRGRGRTVGVISLFRSAQHGPFTAEDLLTAAEVAGRAGLALDNSRLYRQQRRLAEVLQRSMLTDPPEPDHAQVVVRYVPAAEAAQIGGDWYDAFMQRDGSTVVVIGDVVGHDVAAAASMGQVRSLLRGIGVATGADPATLLTQVDMAMRTLQTATIATAVVARIEQTDDERARGLTRIRWSNAGHPPPMVVQPDGTVTVLAGVESDLLLGVVADTRRVESTLTTDRGATLLLYTDGLIERRGQDLRQGLALLRDTLEAIGHLPLEEMCDQVLERLLPERPEDDVALVAVRLHPQDRPRPKEAGPRTVPPDVPPEPEVTPVRG